MSYGKKITDFFQQLDFQDDDAVGAKDGRLADRDNKIVEKIFDDVTVKVDASDFDRYSCVISCI